MSNRPTVRLIQAAYRVMRYLLHPKNFFIHYKVQGQQDQQYKLYAAADSDLAGDQITRRSQTGWFVFFLYFTVMTQSYGNVVNRMLCLRISTAESDSDLPEKSLRTNGSSNLLTFGPMLVGHRILDLSPNLVGNVFE